MESARAGNPPIHLTVNKRTPGLERWQTGHTLSFPLTEEGLGAVSLQGVTGDPPIHLTVDKRTPGLERWQTDHTRSFLLREKGLGVVSSRPPAVGDGSLF